MKKISTFATSHDDVTIDNTNTRVRNVRTIETARAENVDGFHPMNGYTIAQTVAMKIEGFHAKRKSLHGASELRKSPAHFLAVY
jgi:hypothetical protein